MDSWYIWVSHLKLFPIFTALSPCDFAWYLETHYQCLTQIVR